MLFIVIPAVEIFFLIEVGTRIGALATLGVIIATGIMGAALARHQGMSALREVQNALASGAQVGHAGIKAVLVLVAGVLLLTPGFVTDGVGFALLLPPVRSALASWLARRYADRASRVVVFGNMPDPPWMHGPMSDDDDPQDDDYDPPPPGVIDV